MNPEEVQFYEVVPGKLYAGEYPGSWKHRLGKQRLSFLINLGVETFVDLTTREDRLQKYEPLIGKLGKGVKRLSFPIPDMNVPESEDVMRSVLDAIQFENEAGRVCYVHCWGGIGRTGTVIGCYLREQGLSGEDALAKVQRLYAEGMPKVVRHPYSPQTRSQCDYVRRWGESC